MLLQNSEVGYHMGAVAEKRGNKQEAIRFYALGAVANHVRPEARESLLKLTTADSVEKLLETARKELPSYNQFNLGSLVPDLKESAEAEFFIVIAPDASRNAQVVDVKFIKGAESLKRVGPQLKSMKHSLVFPDASPTKIVRRGALVCTAKSGPCTFTLLSPDLVTSVD